MGRNPKPLQLHLLDGNKNRLTKKEIQQREELEQQITFKSDNIKPPTWLSKLAKTQFRKVVKEFEGNDLLKNVDIHSIALFCDAYADYIKCSELIKEQGLMMEHTNKAGETNSVPHPLLTKKKQLFEQMQKFMSEFGLSPVARARLTIPNDKDDTPKSREEEMFGDV
ncbi:phage terminase small subunit P27 family [Bacillus seohaeanensis]|uniref:Phage terminase small subunit P27 family n=1 Tax=Bacillus seohaeanensis TaxID=284580 RepID=A0ABW5RRG2_9BACI